jgi:tight adherence protein B
MRLLLERNRKTDRVLQLEITMILVLLASGGLLAVAFKLSRTARLERERRIDQIAAPVVRANKPISSPKRAAQPTSIDEATRNVFCIGVPYRWGMRSGGLKILGIAVVSAAVTWLLAYRVLGNSVWLASLFAAVAFTLIPRQILKREQSRAEREFMDLLPNAIEMIIRMLRAGLPIVTAVNSVGGQSPPPFSTVFAMVTSQVDIGVPFEKALDAVSSRIGLQDFRFFSVAVTLQFATGGNLAATLEILSDVIRRRRSVRLKGIAATAEVRISAYVLGALPIFALGALLVVNPDYIAPLLYDPRGKYILGTAVGLLAIAILSMRRLMSRVTAA